MQVEIVDSSDALGRRTAAAIAEAALDAAGSRGRFTLAVSGGREPWAAFRQLTHFDLPWHAMHILQVDERIAPAGHRARNWTHLEESLLARVPIPREQVHAMPVENAPIAEGAQRYAEVLTRLAGSPAVIDLVHLGLGDDGHTASLVAGDPVVDVTDRDVAITESIYQGWQRMTLTLPAINRARRIVWLVAGEGKAAALKRLIDGDDTIPAGRVRREEVLLLADRRTAGLLSPGG